ncbi:MAG: CBS domain-containing protein [Deltaproteobacteria bacterium]|nr:CBS domain-containing protein [Deltaproteobacteria bacterium]
MIKVSDWMSAGVLAVEPFDSIAVARQLMAKHRINQLPVVEGEKLLGIVTDRDIRDAYPTSILINRTEEIDRFAEKYTVEEAMSYNVITVKPDTPLQAAVRLLRRHRVGALPVVEKEKLVGIITRSDVLDFVLSGKNLTPAAAGAVRKKKSAGRSSRSRR